MNKPHQHQSARRGRRSSAIPAWSALQPSRGSRYYRRRRGRPTGWQGDPTQAKFIFAKIEKGLGAGAGLQDVVRTRMFVTDISGGKKSARLTAVFAKTAGATMVEVKT
jgi:hypothetical protein